MFYNFLVFVEWQICWWQRRRSWTKIWYISIWRGRGPWKSGPSFMQHFHETNIVLLDGNFLEKWEKLWKQFGKMQKKKKLLLFIHTYRPEVIGGIPWAGILEKCYFVVVMIRALVRGERAHTSGKKFEKAHKLRNYKYSKRKKPKKKK